MDKDLKIMLQEIQIKHLEMQVSWLKEDRQFYKDLLKLHKEV